MNFKMKSEIEKKIIEENRRRNVKDIEGNTKILNVSEIHESSLNKEDFVELNKNICELNRIKINVAFRPLKSNHKIVGPFIVLFKKMVRKILLKWYVEPICFQQTDFNSVTTKGIENIEKILETLEKRNEEKWGNLSKKIDEIGTVHEEKLRRISEAMEKFSMMGIGVPSLVNSYQYTSSQSGEDTIVRYILGGLGIPNEKCTYLDLGANHAIELSNTYWLYRQGARGVLVEANPKLIPELQVYRYGDIIVQKAIADQNGEMVQFFAFKQDGLSTISVEEKDKCMQKNTELQIEQVYQVETITIEKIFSMYFETAPVLINLDIEGYELKILKSINFEKYRPAIIIVETIPYDKKILIGQKDNDIVEYMRMQRYKEYAFTGINSIFVNEDYFI